jgi:hypothetical protein
MDKVVFVKHITCSECAKIMNRLDKEKQKHLKERSQLMRCRGCERLRDTKEDGKKF